MSTPTGRSTQLAAQTPRPGTQRWGDLASHLADVATKAAGFAEFFRRREYAYWAGLFHDLGKCNPKFQAYLVDCHRAQVAGRRPPRDKVPHAIWGAAFAFCLTIRNGGERWKELSLPIQGHHTHLPDAGTADLCLREFLAKQPDALPSMKNALADALAVLGEVDRKMILPRPAGGATQREFSTRMIFSTVVDADRLVSEAHFNPDKSEQRKRWPDIGTLLDAFQRSTLRYDEQSSQVKRIRDEVFAACVAVAQEPPGVFRLTVPTGGGKTRSGLAFALNHAQINELRRVVVALPYTSIIDQTAQVCRDLLGEDAVLEHHSALEVADDESQDELAVRQRLAIENWEAPLVVTTTVQLFESLFADRASKVRKIHRLAKSVIVLDEIQTFPAELLRPTMDVLRLLATPVEEGGYGATIVLSTATQPAFEVGPLADVLGDLRPTEIVPGYEDHYDRMRRVAYEWRPSPLTWAELADELQDERQAMVVVNTRKDALALLAALHGDEEVFHLSTLLCGAHRRAVLARVRQLLREKRPVKLISTQVVECGVDLDFPVVYRALGPLDRIVQAAGRCNRAGRLDRGRVVVFVPAEGSLPSGTYKIGTEKARFLMQTRDVEELHRPAIYQDYFSLVLADVDADGGLDKYGIQEYRKDMNFPQIAQDYRLIREDTVPVVVEFGMEWRWRLDDWAQAPSGQTWQRLQPYLVNLFEREVDRQRGWLEQISDNLYRWTGSYDTERHRGMVAGFTDPSDLFV